MKSTANTTYNFTADLIRALAIFFVLVVHAEPNTSFHTVDWWIANIFVSAAKVAVPLFIMLSGYLLLDDKKSYSLETFYKKRFSRIGIPLLFWPFFYYFSFLFLTKKAFTPIGFFNDYIFLNMFYHLYFLYIIAGLYMITPFIRKFLSSASETEKKYAVCGSFLLSIIITIIHYLIPSRLDYWSIFTVFIPFIPYYLAGDYVRNVSLNKKIMLYCGILYVGLTGLNTLCKFLVLNSETHNIQFINYFSDALSIIVVIMSLMIFVILLQTKRIHNVFKGVRWKKMVKSVSSMALGIYLIHPIFLYLFNKYIQIPHFFFYPLLIVFLVKPILIFAISYIAVYLFKKIPYIVLLFD